MNKVRIKMNANVIYEISNFGNIKAATLLKELFSNEHITKRNASVVESIENCLYDGKEIIKAYYDMLTNEVELYIKEN